MIRSLQAAKGWMLLWIIGSVGGWMLSLAVDFVLNRLRPVYDVVPLSLSPFLPFLITGICLGLLQWYVALKGIVNGRAWVAATTLGSLLVALSIGFVQNLRIAELLMPGCLNAACDEFTGYMAGTLRVAILGAAMGVAFALPTGFVLSHYGSRVYWWGLGCVLAGVAGVLTYTFFLIGPNVCPILLSYAVIDPLIVAAVLAPFLHLTLELPPGIGCDDKRSALRCSRRRIDSLLTKGISMSTPVLVIRTVAVGLVLGIVATVLTFQHQIGLGFTLFGLALLGGLLLFARFQQIQPVRRNLVMLIPAVFFTLMLAVRCHPFLILLNGGAAMIALLLLVFFFRNGNLIKLDLLEYPVKVVLSGIAVIRQPVHEFTQSTRWVAAHREGWPSLNPILRGGVITVPVVTVFVVLLSAADEVFAQLVRDILHIFTFRSLGHLTEQTIYTGIFAWGIIGCLAVALAERKIKRSPLRPVDDIDVDEESDAPSTAARFNIGFTEAVMLLGSISTVFAAFVMIQFVYLFGGERNIANYSYADYVHRGFTELVIVAVLTLGLELTLNAVTIRRSMVQVNIVRGLSTMLILLTAVILLSAFQRLRLYELTYGFTSLRLLIYVFIVWLGIAFTGFALSLYWTPPAMNVFGVTALLVVFGFAATLDLLNPDYFVAMQNINRGDIDPLHFSLLSEEAAPALVALVDAPEPGLRRIVRYTLATYRDRHLGTEDDWRDFNLSRRNVITILNSIEDKLVSGPETMPIWESKIEDFANLHRGMTVREIARRFGLPQAGSDTNVYGDFSRQHNSLLLRYLADKDRVVELRFDSSLGLIAMCARPISGGVCVSMPFTS